MELLFQVLVVIAVLANAVIFGVDVFAAVVQRPALTCVDDATLTAMMGHGHRIADKRFPFFGISGVVSAVLACGVALAQGRGAAADATGLAVVVLVAWLVIFARISAPVNKRLTAAAMAGEVPADARALQDRWESVINVRVALQTIALAALCVALVTAR